MNAASRTAPPDPVGEALIGLAGLVPGAVVVDVGGGSGTRAVPLAKLGCTVLVVDSSIDALAILGRRAADAAVAERISAIQADAAALSTVVPHGAADLVLCHHLLENVDDPVAVIEGIAGSLKPGGVASVLVAGRLAAVLAQAAAGRFGDAAAILADASGRFGPADPLRRRFDIEGLVALLAGGGLEIETITGIGVVSGLVTGGTRPGGTRPTVPRSVGQIEPRLAELEAALSVHPALREIATDLHAVARLTVG
ncbi:SAM-dependent methyltransferase [Nakamurella sp. UYEF19]|uniref:class I SAM-dependent methyltransferase n=1 Tax=Nakamurella sp. UYEF19 TaxID=1756392 RepID=UPI00339A8A2E